MRYPWHLTATWTQKSCTTMREILVNKIANRYVDKSVYWTWNIYMLQYITRTVSNTKSMLFFRRQLPKQQQCIKDINDDMRQTIRWESGFVWVFGSCVSCWRSCRSDAVFVGKVDLDALEQVRVAVGSSAAVAELPDARPELHGTPVTHPTLRGGHAERVRDVTHMYSDP